MKLQKFIIAIVLTLGFWSLGHSVSATHLFGGEVKYEYLDANGTTSGRPFRYKVTYIIYYNDAYGPSGGPNVAPANSSILVRFFTKSTTPGGALSEIPNLNTNPGSPQSFVFPLSVGPPVNPPVPAGCTVTIQQKVRLIYYEKIVSLPASFTGYYTMYSVQARNNGIRNQANSSPNNEALTLYADMGPTFRYNNSPVFTDTAVSIVCSGDTATIINNATDPDGDRLIYSFTAPAGNQPNPPGVVSIPLNPIPYNTAGGFSLSQPFGPGGYAFLNASTGLTKYYIPVAGEYVVSLEIREFRNINGVEQLVGTSVRDIQLFVTNQCGNNASPRLTIPATSYTVQAGGSLSFGIKGSDPDSLSQALTFSGELFGPDGLKIQDLTRITTNGTGIQSTINFTAPCLKPGIYTYNLRVRDSACPLPKTDPKIILINVLPFRGTRIQGDSVVCNASVSKYFVTRPAGSNIAGVTWNIASGAGTITPGATQDTVYVTWTGAGSGTLTSRFLSTAGCADTARRTVTINQGTAPAFTGLANTYCITDGPVTLTGNSSDGSFSGSGVTTASTTTGIFNPAAAGPGTHVVTYTVLTNTCRTTATANVTVNALPAPNFGSLGNGYCVNAAPVPLNATNTTYLVNGTPATGLDPAGLGAGTHTVSATTTNGSCSVSGTRTITISPLPTPSLAFLNTRYCANNPAVTLPAGSGITYSINNGPGIPGGPGALNPAALNVGTNTIAITETNSNCSVTATRTITIDPTPLTDNIAGAISVCPGISGIRYSIVNPRETTYQWSIPGGMGTIASGQGSTSILVNWGTTAGAATVSAQPQNTFGCLGVAATLPVNITQVLATPQPVGPASICLNQASQVRYVMVNPTAGSTFTWSIPGATINSNTRGDTVLVTFNAAGTFNIVVQESSTGSSVSGPVNCFGNSLPFPVTILASPSAALPITGPASVCENAGNTAYTLTGAPATSTFAWTITQNNVTTPLTGTGNTVQFNAAAPGQYTLTTTETNAAGCPGTPISKVVTVTPRPIVTQIQGPAYVCPENLTNRLYYVASTPGQTFNWTVTGGTMVNPGSTNDSIYINFGNAASKEVTVTPVSPTGCAGTPFTLTVMLDPATLQLNVASTADQNEQAIELSLQMPANSANRKQIDVYRREAGTAAFTKAGTIANTTTSFTDNAVQTSAKVYEYYLESTNECGTVLRSTVHRTMLLDVLGNEPAREVYLRWNSYKGWAVTGYDIYGQADNGTYELLRQVGAADTTVTLTNISGRGFTQCFRIRARSADTRVSWSNAGCVNFENPLAFFNIITPNNDGRNDLFVIENIKLYPGNELAIFNRWGKEVYRKKDYDNTWNGRNLSDGTYYYYLTLKDGKSYKGWVEIVR